MFLGFCSFIGGVSFGAEDEFETLESYILGPTMMLFMRV